jgi:hypothetical protein
MQRSVTPAGERNVVSVPLTADEAKVAAAGLSAATTAQVMCRRNGQ